MNATRWLVGSVPTIPTKLQELQRRREQGEFGPSRIIFIAGMVFQAILIVGIIVFVAVRLFLT